MEMLPNTDKCPGGETDPASFWGQFEPIFRGELLVLDQIFSDMKLDLPPEELICTNLWPLKQLDAEQLGLNDFLKFFCANYHLRKFLLKYFIAVANAKMARLQT